MYVLHLTFADGSTTVVPEFDEPHEHYVEQARDVYHPQVLVAHEFIEADDATLDELWSGRISDIARTARPVRDDEQ